MPRLGVDVVELASNRLEWPARGDERETYRRANPRWPSPLPHRAHAVHSRFAERRLQFHLARGCPAHCQYCYLAGSLPGPPVTRAYANLDEILAELPPLEGQGTVFTPAARAHEGTTFEASCYTDPLGIEHLTGSLAATVRFFAGRPVSGLRFTTKYDAVDELAQVDHGGRTRARFSVNSPQAAGMEGGTAPVPARLEAMRRLAVAGYPVGLTVAPIMPIGDWRGAYAGLLDAAGNALDAVDGFDLTVELITHRFTETSKGVLRGWYPGSKLEMDEGRRTLKRTRFGGRKHVYPKELMREMRGFFEEEIARRLPSATILYFTEPPLLIDRPGPRGQWPNWIRHRSPKPAIPGSSPGSRSPRRTMRRS